MDSIKPPRLKKGDLIGLVSPAGTPSPAAKIEGSVRYLEKHGYRARVGEHAAAVHGYLAGTDEQRAGDFNAMVRDPEVKAVFALRGGYGTPRLLSMVDYGALRRRPKIVVGFSDITGLQLAIYRRCGLVTFSGAMPAVEFWKEPEPFTEESFWDVVSGRRTLGVTDLEVYGEGKAEGVLLGGNLSLVTNLVGTRFLPSLREALLVLEEVEEAPYRVDRMLMQLVNAGVAARLAGVLFGQFTRCEAKDPAKPSLTVEEVLREFAGRVDGPVLAGLEYGHVARKLTLPFGVRARLDARRKRVEVIEAAVV